MQTLIRGKQRIQIPHGWIARSYQRPLWTYLEKGGKRAVAVWHRRAGKDSAVINWTAFAAHRKVGVYWHMLPEAAQARKAVWNGIDKSGRRIIDQAFPPSVRAATNGTEMAIHLKCGSIWQVVGSDNYNSLVGSNPIGVVFSEYSLTKPAAWDYIRPILAENGGWAIFIYTPRGKNHGKRLFDRAKSLPDWFCEMLTVDDTHILPADVIESERREGMSEEMIQQEYFCSFEGAVEGAYYAKELKLAREEERVCKVPYARTVPCNTFWDLGTNDTTAIWVHQYVRMQHRFLKCYENSGEPLTHYAKWLIDSGFMFDTHYLPHDATHRKLGREDVDSPEDSLKKLLPGHKFEVVPRTPDVLIGIQQTRALLGECFFDETGCEGGLDAISQYHKEWDEDNQCWKPRPHHDWSSNYADALRMFGQGWKDSQASTAPKLPVPHTLNPGVGL